MFSKEPFNFQSKIILSEENKLLERSERCESWVASVWWLGAI